MSFEGRLASAVGSTARPAQKPTSHFNGPYRLNSAFFSPLRLRDCFWLGAQPLPSARYTWRKIKITSWVRGSAGVSFIQCADSGQDLGLTWCLQKRYAAWSAQHRHNTHDASTLAKMMARAFNDCFRLLTLPYHPLRIANCQNIVRHDFA